MSLICLLLVYYQQTHTFLMSEHQRIMINLMYLVCDEYFLYLLNAAITLVL